jgi:hypothetical protein
MILPDRPLLVPSGQSPRPPVAGFLFANLIDILQLQAMPSGDVVTNRHRQRITVRLGKHKLTPRRKDAKMNENGIGKEVVDAAVRVHRESFGD